MFWEVVNAVLVVWAWVVVLEGAEVLAEEVVKVSVNEEVVAVDEAALAGSTKRSAL